MDAAAIGGVDGFRTVWEDGGIWIVEIVLADGIADGLGAAAELGGDAVGNFFDAMMTAGSQGAGGFDNVITLFRRE